MTTEAEKKPRASKYAPAPIPAIGSLVDERLTGAACAGMAPLFDAYLDDESTEQREYRHHRAKTICLRCPVRTECTVAATEHDASGIWNGRLQESIERRKQHDNPHRSQPQAIESTREALHHGQVRRVDPSPLAALP